VANTYTVVPADVAAELPGLFPGGFSATTRPTDAQVQGFIDTADTIVTLRVRDNVGTDPANTDRAAPIARRYILNYVLAIVTRIVYAGNDAVQVNAMAAAYDVAAKTLLDSITALGEQAIGTGTAAPEVLGNMTTRSLMLCDADLDPRSGLRGRW
jgi:hypothetical protein